MNHKQDSLIVKKKGKTDLDDMLINVGEAFISLDQNWKCIYVNDWAIELLNKKREELMNHIIWEVFPDMRGTVSDNDFRLAMNNRVSMSFDIEHTLHNKWLHARVIPHDNGIDVFYNDITERKLIKKEKEQTEERFVKAFESSPIPLSISRQSDEYIVDANKSFLELFEFSRKEVIGSTHNLLKIQGQNLNVKNNGLISSLQKKNALNKHELILYTKSRKPLNIIVSTELIHVNGEQHVLSTFIDLTEKFKSQKIIAESEAWFRSIADNSPVMIWGCDNNQNCNYVNTTWIEFTGYATKHILKYDWINVIHPDDLENFQKTYFKAFDAKKAFKREYRLKRTDGRYRWVFDFAKPIIMPDGSFKGYIGSCTDIHNKKTLYNKLEKLVKERTLELTQSLEKEKSLNDAKSRFVSMASHEFRTPLSSILSSIFLVEKYTELIEKNHESEYIENREKHITRIKKSINHLTEILNDFLSLDKLDQGKIVAKKEEFNLKQFSEEIIEEMKNFLKDGQYVKHEHTGKEIISQDKNILKNIYLNLLSNAVKYSNEGKEIRLKIDVTNKKVSIKVEDNGIGIPKKDQGNLFTKFFRAENALNIEGTGLGLNIVKRYTELMDGSINFCSEADKGTTFIVQFPRNL